MTHSMMTPLKMTYSTRAAPVDHRVVVLGGGYAGVLAANRLRKNSRLTVTLVNPAPDSVERIRLHQWVADSGTARHPLSSMVADKVRSVVDRAERIDAPHAVRSSAPIGCLAY